MTPVLTRAFPFMKTLRLPLPLALLPLLIAPAAAHAEPTNVGDRAFALPGESDPAFVLRSGLRGAGSLEASGPARLIARIEGLEIRARELADGSQIVGLFNLEGRKPTLDETKAAYTSPVLSHKTPGRGADIDVPLNGSRKLYLAANDAGDGNSGDHADWIEPRLTGPAGELRLTDLKWASASTGWGSVKRDKSVGGGELRLGDKKAAYGLGVHADSVLEYDLPAGYTRFKARVGVDNGGGSRGSVKFSVFTVDPWKRNAGPETIEVALRDLNFATPCAVRDLLTGREAPRATESVSASVARGAAAVFHLRPEKAAARTSVRSGDVWGDTEGRVIQAHGGGLLFHQGVYYWYGEYKNGPTRRSPVERVDVIGVSCYSSRDLLNWKFEGLALKGVNETGHDLHPSMVLERPKVVYNAKTGKFVMWAHIDSAGYGYARAGVAVSDTPAGPFTYLGSVRPDDSMSRDMTVFVDDDGTAYHVYSSENNATLHISRLSEDYTKHAGDCVKVFEKKFLEAPALFKRGGKYYMMASGQSGWAPNPAHACMADNIRGPWVDLGNPCRGPKAHTTFDGQSTHVLPIAGKKDAFIFMADRWNPPNLRDSRYIWLPIRFEGDKPVVDWAEEWKPDSL